MTRIGVISSWFTDIAGGSGTAVFFNSLVEGLGERGFAVDIITSELAADNYNEATYRRLLFNTDLTTDARVQSADVLIGLDYDGYGLQPGRRPPLIMSVHAIYRDLIPWEQGAVRTMVETQAFFDQVALNRADVVTVGSVYGKQRLVELYNVSADKITVLHHGRPVPSWLPLVDAAPRQANNQPVVLFVGKLYPRKRADLLLRAVPLLRERFPDIEIRMVGDGIEWDRLHRLVDELDIASHVTWLAHIADDAAFAAEWRQADVVCHPSAQETFGFVYVEAMLLGKPIVAVRAGAAPEVIGDAGLLVEPENVPALAAAIECLLSDTALREVYRVRGRRRVQQFSYAAMIDGYVEMIEKLVR